MYLMYVDESGDMNSPERENVVLAGVAVHEADVRRLGREVEAVLTRRLDEHLRGLELHAQHIRKGKGGWRGVPPDVRRATLDDVAGLLASFEASQPFALFAVVREPGAVPRAEPIVRAYEELALRFNAYLKKRREQAGVRHWGMFVGDEAKYESIVQPLMTTWSEGRGTRFGKLTRIAEVPLFVDSKASRMIQLADFVAHAVYVAYERHDTRLFDRILPRFQREDSNLHGLVHLTTRRDDCSCIACDSRRQIHVPLPMSLPPPPSNAPTTP